MALQFLLFILYTISATFAFSIPHNAQTPLVPAPQHEAPSTSRVMLVYSEAGLEGERAVEIPLGVRTSTGTILPKHPETIKIITLMNGQRHGAPLEQLDNVRCWFEVEFSREEKAVFASGIIPQKKWPSFGIEDGTVEFTQPSEWFLAGREIGSFECW